MQQTPLAKLQNRKEWIRLESNEKQIKLKEHFSYIKDNAGSLAISGLTSLILPGSKNDRKKDKNKNASLSTKTKDLFSPINLLSSFSTRKGIVPLAMEIAQPFLITWGFKMVKKLIKKIFSGKK